ncbi:MAG: WG repeat-containing protein [Rikenellaceae bacterium]
MITVTNILTSVDRISEMLRTIVGIEPLYGEDGELEFHVGNMAIAFKVRYQGATSLLKCYLVNHSHLRAIYGERYYPRELLCFNFDEQGEWVDVVIDRWCDGQTLLSVVEECVDCDNKQRLSELAYRFDTLALELLRSSWAHGDLTLENIIVAEDGSLKLIDFDATYLPELSEGECCEIGTDAFQHPKRDISCFDCDIDDYSIALIYTGLHLLSQTPELFTERCESDGFIFTSTELIYGECELYSQVLKLFARSGDAVSYSVAKLLTSCSYAMPQLKDYLSLAMGERRGDEAVESFPDVDRWGFKSASGEVVIPAMYDSAFDFSCSVAAVQLGGYWHYIWQDGTIALNCSDCEAIKPARSGYFRVLRNSQWHEIPIKNYEL